MFPYIDLLLELFVHVVASFLVPLVRSLQLLLTHSRLIYRPFPLLLRFPQLVLFKSNLVEFHLLILVFKHFLPLRFLYEVLHTHLHLVFNLHKSKLLVLLSHTH